MTFVLAYIPYLGAFVSGAFAVLLALSSQGTTAAIIMLIVVLLANGLLQHRPADRIRLDVRLEPLVVLIVSTGFGAIFGMVGLVLAAPLTSAAVHISRELSAAKAADAPNDVAERAAPDAVPSDPLAARWAAGCTSRLGWAGVIRADRGRDVRLNADA